MDTRLPSSCTGSVSGLTLSDEITQEPRSFVQSTTPPEELSRPTSTMVNTTELEEVDPSDAVTVTSTNSSDLPPIAPRSDLSDSQFMRVLSGPTSRVQDIEARVQLRSLGEKQQNDFQVTSFQTVQDQFQMVEELFRRVEHQFQERFRRVERQFQERFQLLDGRIQMLEEEFHKRRDELQCIQDNIHDREEELKTRREEIETQQRRIANFTRMTCRIEQYLDRKEARGGGEWF
ncbi:hypothetical protein Hypma_016531 [Hypsizygus marmoreus]|uniref:Uncharacterized protein n=1 Tax=Hypsizygus marmoreus TaxID=39966 RepID=A0A369IYW0_HYPMA|nr:hypothetical protein Hypma_016531 [Hypsizygus marmoreus]